MIPFLATEIVKTRVVKKGNSDFHPQSTTVGLLAPCSELSYLLLTDTLLHFICFFNEFTVLHSSKVLVHGFDNSDTLQILR